MQNIDMILLAIFLIGILVTTIYLYIKFIITIYDCRLKENVCTEYIDAYIVSYKTIRLQYGRIGYIPTYQYEYNGKVYEYKAHIERHKSDSLLNQNVSRLINPDDPNMLYEEGSELYNPRMAVYVGVFVVGILWIFGYIIKYLIFGL